MSEERDTVTIFTHYEWDCPGCGEVNDERDVAPSGEVECLWCGLISDVGETV